jgi:hypothetical protein
MINGTVVSLWELVTHAPAGICEPSIVERLRRMPFPPRALDLLHVLDDVVYGGLACDRFVEALDAIVHDVAEEEGTTFEELERRATWRDPDGSPA